MLPTRRAKQGGQAFLWFLATLAACCGLLMIVFNVGQVATEKERTTNAADAVAMSGGIVQARFMNLLAYNNRVIVADEMTIAQFAALDSWVEYNRQVTQNVATVTSWIPYVDDITQGIADVMQVIADVVTAGADAVAPAFQAAVDVMEAQRTSVLNPNAIFLAVQDMSSQVAAQNNVDMNDTSAFTAVATAALEQQNNGFFIDHKKDANNNQDDRQAAADILMNSRDYFTTWRGAGTIVDTGNALLKAGGANPIAPQLQKTSGTTGLRDFDHWESQDSMDLVLSACIPFTSICDSWPTLPVGWGRANVNNDDSSGSDWATTSSPANYNMQCQGFSYTLACDTAYSDNPDSIQGWKGVPNMLDVKDGNRQSDIRYFVSVKTKSASPPLTSQQMNIANTDLPGPQGSPRVTDNLANNQLQTISAVRVFFSRPSNRADKTAASLFRGDTLQEYGSLYNPYWQARLHTPNCNLTSDPTSQDCQMRGLLALGNNALGVEAAVDAVTPP